MQKDLNLRPRATTRTYSIDHRKLGQCLLSIPLQRDILANSQKITKLEELMLV